MTYNPDTHHRRSSRLPGYDYTLPGAYFVTLVCHERECLFGDIRDGEVRLNAFGQVVAEEWERTAMIRFNVAVDSYVIMPNHLHGILVIMEMTFESGVSDRSGDIRAHSSAPLPDASVNTLPNAAPPSGPVRAHCRAPGSNHPADRTSEQPTGLIRPPQSLGAIIGGFKAASTRRVNSLRQMTGVPIWQRNYFEHIIRSDRSWERIRNYIEANPSRWTDDTENPDRVLR